MSPFKSEKQRRFLWLKHPNIARKWTKESKQRKRRRRRRKQ